MPNVLEGESTAGDHRFAIVVARFNNQITDKLLSGCLDTLRDAGVEVDSVPVVKVPGSLELPIVARRLAESGGFAAVIVLGCVIRGETDHYDHVTEQTAKGIREVGTKTGVPCIFGVITADTLEQAINRAGGKQGNQGSKAMFDAVEMANMIKKM